ncbi:hypothetical protein N7513_010653 [Penicillium frequentans]|nr:hypothetical protein N7513_010653 [Penicillium glabrum]
MAVESKAWDSILEPSSICTKSANFPATMLLSNDVAINSQSSIGQDSRNLQVSYLNEIQIEGRLVALIEGYARWIMTILSQTRVAFCIAELHDEKLIRRGVILAETVDGDETMSWEVHGITSDSDLVETASLEFGLYITNNDSAIIELQDSIQAALSIERQTYRADLVYRARFNELLDITDVISKLQLQLKLCAEQSRAVSFYNQELQGFAGICERQFPTIACERLSPSPGEPSTLAYNTALETSWEALELFAQQYHCLSATSIVRTAFASILAEFLESDRIIIGDRTMNSSSPETSAIRLIPIQVLPEDTPCQSIARIDEFCVRGANVPNARLGLLRDILKTPKEHNPYNALFTFIQANQSTQKDVVNGPERACAPIDLQFQRSEDGRATCTLLIMTHLMDDPHAQLLLRQIDALITAMSLNPSESFQSLNEHLPQDLLSLHIPRVSKELEQAPLLSPAHWVDHWTASHPDWIALEIVDKIDESELISRKWTYRELSLTSDRICAWIKSHGWHKESIAVCLGRSFMAYALVLAIWKSGNCYVPVAEDLPETRQVFLLADSGARAFFTNRALLEKTDPFENCRVIDIDNHELTEESNETGVPVEYPESSPPDNCYLLYTSGSTGTPKGVLVSRGNLSAFTEAQSEYICRDVPDTKILGGRGSYLAHASRAFDVHICEMVLAWRHGLRLVTGPRTMLLDNLFLVLSRLKITHAGFVPSLLEHASVSAEKLPDLRYLGVGGEKLSETIIERFVGKPSISLVNAYGPTEVTIGMTSHTVKPSSTIRNIGIAVGNITIYVLQPDSTRHVKRGVPGELCVTGDLVANGYHRRPDAAGFVDFHGQRMYRTGDIVRLMANNCIEYLGRRDSQAKIRGQRLELEEVSIAIKRCAGFPVNVTSMDVATEPQFLVEKYQAWVPDILERCRVELPAYMVPSVLLPLSSIPIQISGKADNRRLVALYQSIPLKSLLLSPKKPKAPAPAADLLSASTTMTNDEEIIRQIILCHVDTDMNSITKSTSLLQLGVDSLGLLSIATKLRSVGYRCSAADVFNKATIEQLASLPRSESFSTTGMNSTDLGDGEAEASQKLGELDRSFRLCQTEVPNTSVAIARPCLPLQESLVSSSLGSPTPLYVNHIMLRVGPGFTLARLKVALEDLMHENEILRTCFHVTKNKVLQVVLKARAASLSWSQISATDESSAVAIFRALQIGIASTIVQRLEKEPPFHVTAATSTDTKSPGWIMLSIHHSVFDGSTMGLFLDKLYHHYTGDAAVCSVDPSPLYRYFITIPTEHAVDFWTRYLHNCSPTLISTEKASQSSYDIATKQLPLTLKKLAAFASSHSTTPPMILETVWAIVLAKQLGQRDVMYGRVMNGRGIPVEHVESMLMPLVTTIPGRFELLSERSKLLEHIEAQTLAIIDAFRFQHTPLRMVQRCAGAPGPLFNSLFSYLVTHPRSPADDMICEIDSVMAADYPLALEVQACSDSDSVTLRLRAAHGINTGYSDGLNGDSFVDTISSLIEELLLDGDVIVEAAGIFTSQNKQSDIWDEEHWAQGELLIRQAVLDIIGVPEHLVSKNASFFALGVDSIISIHLARRMQELAQENLQEDLLKVTPSDILRYPNIGAIYSHLEQLSASSSASVKEGHPMEAKPLTNTSKKEGCQLETYCCTPLQTAMIGQCLSSEGKTYVHHHVVALVDTIDIDRLVSAWQEVITEVDILRTSFYRPGVSRDFHAQVNPTMSMQWTNRDNVDSLASAIDEISRETAYPDLSTFEKPPWHLTLLSGESRKLMILTMHHSLYDGFSLPMLFDCVERVYNGELVRVKPFAPIACRIVSGQQGSVQFWTDEIAGYQYPGLSSQTASADDLVVACTQAAANASMQELKEVCGTLGVTMQTLALLTFGRCLASLLHRRDIVFGHVVSGRGFDTCDAASVIGPLFNTVPLRLKFESPSESLHAVLQSIQSFSLKAQPHQHAPLSLIQRAWRLENTENGSSLFDAIFTFNKSSRPDPQSIFQPYVSETALDVPHYRLNVEFEQTPDSLIIRATSRDLLSKNELEAWIQNMTLDIDTISRSSGADVLDLPTGGEISRLLSPKQKIQVNTVELSDEPNMQVLKGIFSEVAQIPVEKIDGNTNIFTLGIDSILALDITARCRKAGLTISVSDILQGQTIHGILAMTSKPVIENLESGTGSSLGALGVSEETKRRALSLLSISEQDVELIAPCLSGQSFYISSWLRSRRTHWAFTFALHCQRKIDLKSLQRAWSQLKKHHSILRTSFAAVSAIHILQIISKANESKDANDIEVHECSGELQSFLGQLTRSDRHMPFDLFTPPVRLRLVQHSEGDVLLLTLHHALYDAWSLPILFEELENLYGNQTLSRSCDFSSFLSHAINRNNSDESKAYWNSTLARGDRTLIGKDSIVDLGSMKVHSAQSSFPLDLDMIQSQCREAKVSVPSLILLVVGRTLARITTAVNPTFGLFQSGRSNDYPDIHKLAAPTVNMLPIVVPEALKSPCVETLSTLQADLVHRSIYDQANLHQICQMMRTSGNELKFDVILNIVWGQLKHGVDLENTNALFSPLALESQDDNVDELPSTGQTSVDQFDHNDVLGRDHIYIEVSSSEEGNSLQWRVDYLQSSVSDHQVNALLATLEEDMNNVRGDLFVD